MAVPNTTTFTLQDVETEIAGAQTSLAGCFAAANAGGFDPAYEGSKTSLLNFRNYTDICVSGLTGFTFYPTATTSGAACGPVGGATTYYHDGVGSRPANADKIYTSSDGCTLFNGGGSWFSDFNGVTRNRFIVSSVGVVSSLTAC